MNQHRNDLPWLAILVALACALGFVYLVVMARWSLPSALGLVTGGAAMLVLGLLAVVLILAGRGHRRSLWRSFRDTVRRDWQALVRYYSGRR